MPKIKVAVFDMDKGYRERFADYLMSYKAAELELAVFSSHEFFCDALKEETFHLLVLGSGYEEVIASAKIYQVPILILTREIYSYVHEEIALHEQGLSYIGKYQSMDVITKKMWMMAEEKRLQGKSLACSRKIEVVGVFSPAKHELQMLYSLLYAKNLARERKVLYISLLEFSGFSEIFGETTYDLGDAISCLREQVVEKEGVLNCIYEGEGFSYISPLSNPENIREITADDVAQLLQMIKDYTDFAVIILDISTSVNCMTEVFRMCSRLYSIEKKGFLYEAGARQFIDFMEKSVDTVVLERIHRVIPPCQTRVLCGGSNLLEQLDWGELGDFVREQL